MVNFYANWCKFSRILTPVYEELGKTLSPEFPQPNKLVVGRVDCDAESELCGQLSINKYPTLKMWRYGQLAKREYRGQRSVEALSEHLRGQLTDPITAVDSLNKLNVDEVILYSVLEPVLLILYMLRVVHKYVRHGEVVDHI